MTKFALSNESKDKFIRKFETLKISQSACKSTSTRLLEHEMAIQSLVVFLKEPRLRFVGRTKDPSIKKKIQFAFTKIKLAKKAEVDIRADSRRCYLAHWLEMCGEGKSKG